MDKTFNPGDRVIYKGNSRGNPQTQFYIGRTGTINKQAEPNRYSVAFDDGTSMGAVHEYNLEVYDPPSSEEVEAAIALLTKAGKVSFEPHKPPFALIEVTGVGNYSATITDKNITVGCTTISFEKFDEIAKAVQAVRDYNNS